MNFLAPFASSLVVGGVIRVMYSSATSSARKKMWRVPCRLSPAKFGPTEPPLGLKTPLLENSISRFMCRWGPDVVEYDVESPARLILIDFERHSFFLVVGKRCKEEAVCCQLKERPQQKTPVVSRGFLLGSGLRD